MRNIFRLSTNLWALLLAAFLFAARAQAAPVVEIQEEQVRINLPAYVDVLEDVEGRLTLEDVVSERYAHRFVPAPLTELFFGYTRSVYWLRFVVQNRLDHNKPLVLEVSPADIDHVDLYAWDRERQQMLFHKPSGSSVSFDARDYEHPLYYFDVPVPAGSEQVYFLRLESNKTINIHLKLSSPREHFFYGSIRDWWQGFLFGALLILAAAHFWMYFVFRYNAFAYCGSWLVSMVLIQGSWNGYYVQFLDAGAVVMDRQLIFSIYLSAIFGLLFARTYLDTHRRTPLAHRVLTFFLLVSVMAIPCAWLLSPAWNALLLGIIATPISFFIFGLGVYGFLDDYEPARYFLLARTVTTVMILVAVFADQGLLPDAFTITYGLAASFVFEGLVFLVAMVHNCRRQNLVQASSPDASAVEDASAPVPLAAFCHELRTPVSGVMGMSELLLDTSLTQQQRAQVESIHASGKALLDVVSKLSDLAAIESGELELREGVFEITSLVEWCVENVRPLAEQRHLEIIYQVDDSMSGWVFGDRDRLQQVVCSLAYYSIRHLETGEVLLTVRSPQPDQMMFEVVSGRNTLVPESNIFPDHLAALAARSSEGLNLTIARRLIALMGGELQACERPDGGFRFVFQLPLRKQKRELAQNEAEGALQGKCLLVVDDNETCCRILQQQASRWGMEVLCAAGAKEALALLRSRAALDKPVHLLLADYDMSGMNGVDLLERVLQEREALRAGNLRMMILTGVSKMPGSLADRHLGEVRVLYKPLSGKSLKLALLEALR